MNHKYALYIIKFNFEFDVKNMFEVDIERSSYHRYVWNGGDK